MKKILIAIVVIITLIFGSRYLVFKKPTKVNPISYTYNAPIDSVRKKVTAMFAKGKFHKFDFETGRTLSLQQIKLINNNSRDNFFVNWFGWFSSVQESETYYNWWGKLKLIPSYHIVLDSVSSTQTKITINSFPKVEAGTSLGFSPPLSPRKVEVQPSTIEEYKIIMKIGEQLGEKDMPAVQTK